MAIYRPQTTSLSSMFRSLSKIVLSFVTVNILISIFTRTGSQSVVLAHPLSSGSDGGSYDSSSAKPPPNMAVLSIASSFMETGHKIQIPIPAKKSHTTINYSYILHSHRKLLTSHVDKASIDSGPTGLKCFFSSFSEHYPSDQFPSTTPEPSPPRSRSSRFISSFLRSGSGSAPSSSRSTSSYSSPSQPPPPPPVKLVSPTFSQDEPWPESSSFRNADELTCFIVEDENTLVAWTVNQKYDDAGQPAPLRSASRAPRLGLGPGPDPTNNPASDLIFINIGSESGSVVFPDIQDILAAALVSAPTPNAECVLVTGLQPFPFSMSVPCIGTLGLKSAGINCFRDFRGPNNAIMMMNGLDF